MTSRLARCLNLTVWACAALCWALLAAKFTGKI